MHVTLHTQIQFYHMIRMLIQIDLVFPMQFIYKMNYSFWQMQIMLFNCKRIYYLSGLYKRYDLAQPLFSVVLKTAHISYVTK